MAALTPTGACACPARGPDSISPNLPLKTGPCCSQRIPWNVFVYMDRLGMLPQIVEPRKPPGTMALKGAFSGMFPIPNMSVPSYSGGVTISKRTLYDVPSVHFS